jgi:hypothetical protein
LPDIEQVFDEYILQQIVSLVKYNFPIVTVSAAGGAMDRMYQARMDRKIPLRGEIRGERGARL